MSLSGYSHSPRPRAFLCTAFVASVCLIQLWIQSVDAFAFQSVVPTTVVPHRPADRRVLMALHAVLSPPQNDKAPRGGRRSFFRKAAAATVAAAGLLAFTPIEVLAVEDLAMPTVEEQKKLDDVRARII